MSPTEATLLVHRIREGDPDAAEALLPLVYEQLRATAGSYFRAQRADHTLQPTALVHEAYLKLVRAPDNDWEGRAHFCAVAAKAMKQILSDHARSKRAAKRGGPRGPAGRVAVTSVESPSSHAAIDLLALDEALDELAAIDGQGAEVVHLRFFGGLSNEDAARVLGVSLSTVERSWRRCRAWLRSRLGDPGATESAQGATG
ncbi:MAG: sigma-70 family RNA polymerase sigma factor [Phycisphaeraceae bacterium]|nr:MAG: sigma-70 family RNA polymerase sigma factor [Phycisphaeraceae bacterium]